MTNERGSTWVLVAAVLASSMAFIDGSAVNVTLPAIQSSMHASGPELLWFVDGYILMLASLILVGGTLGDRRGRKRIFMVGIGLFVLSSVACALAPTALVLVVSRLVQGIGGALMIPGSLALISTYFPSERRGAAIGTWSTFTTITTAGGPILGGFLADAGLWRAVFLINVPIGIVAFAILQARVPRDMVPATTKRIDVPGALAATIALAALTYGFIEAPAYGFASPLILGSLAIGVASVALFIVIEARSREPMVPLTVFLNRSFAGANLLTLFLYGALGAFTFFLPLTMIQSQGYRASEAGFSLLPFVALLAGMSRAAGRLSDRIGARLPLVVGPSLVALGFLTAALSDLAPGSGSYWSIYFPAIVLFGAGMGITVVPLTTTVMTSLEGSLTGTASGVNNAVSRMAGVLTIAVFGALALLHFPIAVHARISPGSLNPAQLSELDHSLGNLGNASVPVDAPNPGEVSDAIKAGLLEVFRGIALGCAALAAGSALFAALFLKGRARSASPAAG